VIKALSACKVVHVISFIPASFFAAPRLRPVPVFPLFCAYISQNVRSSAVSLWERREKGGSGSWRVQMSA